MPRLRVPRWSPSADGLTGRIDDAGDGEVRVLEPSDTPALRRLLARDPVSGVSVAALLASRGTAGPGRGRSPAMFLGIDAGDGELDAACWVGSNINPVEADARQAALFGQCAARLRRRVSSIYGPADAVLSLFEATEWVTAREVRESQPLMVMDRRPEIDPLPGVRLSVPEEFGVLEPACAAMFTEELGFSPYTQGVSQYHDRIRTLIAGGHSLVRTDPSTGEVVFKAEFGAVTPDVVQVQGVWVRPRDRGRGLAAPGMAAVVRHGLSLAPTVSLYVNSFNESAVRAYRRVGFEQVGTFATVLF
ncbi:MAG: GNAT family N-acetyltransferase [Nesterenkonia sp.]|nr:GNAT family N-acetyltransferase [Nesterenkonia sp.]